MLKSLENVVFSRLLSVDTRGIERRLETQRIVHVATKLLTSAARSWL